MGILSVLLVVMLSTIADLGPFLQREGGAAAEVLDAALLAEMVPVVARSTVLSSGEGGRRPPAQRRRSGLATPA